MITELGRLLTAEPGVSPQTILESARRPGRSIGALARALEGFFIGKGLAFELDQSVRLAKRRRDRRLEAIPLPLRKAVVLFAEHQVRGQQRARRAGTRPHSDHTVETKLATLRDFAAYLMSQRGKSDWATAERTDVEAFLGDRSGNRAKTLGILREFFRWARSRRLTLVDPTKDLASGRARGFKGQTLTLDEQRRLFRRWTAEQTVHPHEALVGLLALLHAASNEELRGLKLTDIDTETQSVRLGRRPQPVPLDPASWEAVQICLAHRAALNTLNPHAIVTRITRTRQTPASAPYLTHVLDSAGVCPKVLRSTRLVDLVASMDPKLVAEAFGLNPDGVSLYLADYVQEARLANL